MGKAKSVVTQKQRKTVLPFILYILISAFFLPAAAMKSYGRSLETLGGFSMNSILQFFQNGNHRIAAVVQTVFSLNPWENQYRKAELERRQLEFRIAELRRRLEEVEQLRQVLGLNRDIRWNHVNAEIIVRSGSYLQGSVTIDVGSADGIYRDAPVIGFAAGKYGLIGKVQTTSSKQSTVLSLVNRYYQIGVTAMLEKSRFQGILSSGGKYYRLDFVSRQARDTIQSGDLVISVGSKDSLYPRGIPIGHILQVEELEYNASLSLLIKPIVDLSQVEYVAVLIEDSSPEPKKLKQLKQVKQDSNETPAALNAGTPAQPEGSQGSDGAEPATQTTQTTLGAGTPAQTEDKPDSSNALGEN